MIQRTLGFVATVCVAAGLPQAHDSLAGVCDMMTLGSAAALAQRGIGKTGANALQTGDEIKVKFLPARDGNPLGILKTVIMPDGRVIQISAGNPND